MTAFDAAGAAPLGADGAIELLRGGHLEAALSGLEPGSSFTISLLGVATPLASATASADGTGSATVQVPASIAAGPHTLVVTVTRADGSTMTMQLGYRLLDAQDVSVTSPLWTGWWVLPLVVLLLLVAVAWWVIAARRRRREEED